MIDENTDNDLLDSFYGHDEWWWCIEANFPTMLSYFDSDDDEKAEKDFAIMQSTGLKDKNGRLIYEGDIVKSFHVSSTMQGRVFTGFVAYDDERCRYCISENKHCGYVTFSDTDDVFEVIGNIYENKELLNENS